MADTEARRLLAALARDDGEYRDTGDNVPMDVEYGTLIDRATAATEDLASAAAFLADHDLDELAAAVERAERDLSERVTAGRNALETLRRFNRAADGQPTRSDPTHETCDHTDRD